jgi:beta-ureidopropionase / N-carbamoyl-L-amino-acid hydrolase
MFIARAGDQRSLDFGLELARDLFAEIRRRTFDGVGVTRPAYGDGEQLAHDLVARAAHELGLLVRADAALNLSMTLPGSDPAAPALIVGSHLDSVPQGGNYDGLAGVLAGLACMAGLREQGALLRGDTTVMAFRGEENAWFAAQHIGSRAALGLLKSDVLDHAKRIDTGRTLADHMTAFGADLTVLRSGQSLLNRSRVGAFLELHIEQGPTLDQRELPIGLVTGIRGLVRFREIVCRGAYGHSGVVPRHLRHDAVISVSEVVSRMDKLWQDIEAEGGDLVLTFGKFFTNPAAHGITTIPGELTFCFDARSHSSSVLDRVASEIQTMSHDIARRRAVSMTFSPIMREAPINMDAQLMEKLLAGCAALDIPSTLIASGASHDSGDFAAAGIPSAMIFVRNQNGSHNPQEAMQLADFAVGVRLMDWFIRSFHHVN